MAGTTLSADCGYYSSLADDPDLCDLVEMFAGEMPDQHANLEKCDGTRGLGGSRAILPIKSKVRAEVTAFTS